MYIYILDSRLHGQGTPMIAITGESTSIVLSENQYLNNMGSEVEGLFFTNTDGYIYNSIYIYIYRNKRIKDPSYITVENMNITTFSNREEKVYTPSLDLTQLASTIIYIYIYKYIYIFIYRFISVNRKYNKHSTFGYKWEWNSGYELLEWSYNSSRAASEGGQ